MLRNWKKALGVLTLVAVMIIGLTACNDNGEEASNDDGSVEYAQGVTDDTVKIGTVGVMSGPLSFIGTPYFAGMQAYIQDVNEQGGVHGRQVELIMKDDEFDPSKSIEVMEDLIYDEEVFAIIGHLGTPGVVATADMVQEEGIPSVYFGAGAVELTELGENFFPVQPNYVYEGALKAQYAIEEFDADTIAVVYSDDDTGNDGLRGVKEGLEVLGREDALVAELSFGAGDTDFTVQAQRVQEADPDLIIVYGVGGGTVNFLQYAEEYNLDKPMLTTYSNADNSFLTLASESAPEAVLNLHVMGWLDVQEDSLTPLYEAMEKYQPEAPINAYTMAGWVAAETFMEGLRAAEDNLSWDGFISAMNTLDFTGDLGQVIYYEEGFRQGVTNMAVSRVVQLDDGTFTFEQMTDFNEFEAFLDQL